MPLGLGRARIERKAPREVTATIALVDDDRNILTSVSIALQAEGFLTRVYSDGETALKALTDNPPDLAVLDVKMPRMDGMELLQRLRENSALPVIFLTSKDDELDEARGLALGADDYIAKPFSQRLLIARIRAILRRTEMRATPPSQVPDEKQQAQDWTRQARNLAIRLDMPVVGREAKRSHRQSVQQQLEQLQGEMDKHLTN